MRTLIAAGLGFVVMSTAALAQAPFTTWVDPDGALAFRHPRGWQVNTLPSSDPSMRRFFLGAGDYECQIWVMPNAASAAPEVLRQRTSQPISSERWTRMVETMDYFQGGVEIESQSVDASQSWPIQRVLLRGARHSVRGALTARPGVEFLSLCLSYDGEDRSAVFAAIEASIGPPGEAPGP